MNKYNVRFYLHTYVDFGVMAETPEEANDIANGLEYDMDQLLDNMVPTDETEITEILDENEEEENKQIGDYYEMCYECDEEIAVTEDMVDWTTGIFTCPLCGTKQHLCSMCRIPDENSRKCTICTLKNSQFKRYENI